MYKIMLIQFVLFSFSLAKNNHNVTGTVLPTYNNKANVEDNHTDNHEIDNYKTNNNKFHKSETDYIDADNNGLGKNETNDNEINKSIIFNNEKEYTDKDNNKIGGNVTNNNEKVNHDIDKNKTYYDNETNNYKIDKYNKIENSNEIENKKINDKGTVDNKKGNNKIYNTETDNNETYMNDAYKNVIDVHELDNNDINDNKTDSNEIYNNETNKNEIDSNKIYNNYTVNNKTDNNEINKNETYENKIDKNERDNVKIDNTDKINYKTDSNEINTIGIHDNEIDSEEIDNNERDIIEIEEDTCKLSVLPPNPNSMCCGVDLSSSNRIIGGKPASINQYPWMAIIFEKSKKTGKLTRGCGGALISSLYVLTAAHCCVRDESDDTEPYIVDLGDHDIDHNGPDCVIMRGREICSDGETIIKIAMTISHPMFNIHKSEAHDIALIKLASKAPYTDGIRPICLPTFDINKSSLKHLWLYIAGWGTMQEVWIGNELESILSNVKRHAHVPFINNQKCNQSVTYAEITTSQVCAGGLKNRGTCTGDSGGPLMFNNGGQFEVTGVVSFGPSSGCGQEGKPDVFTNVFRYKEWVFEVINKGIAEGKE